METAIIAALAAVLGVVIGSLLTERREHRTWLRDQKMQVYSELIGLSEYADNIRSDVWDVDRFREYQQRHNDLLARISLIGSQEMVLAAGDLHRLGGEVYAKKEEDLKKAVNAFTTQLLKTIQIARKELGLPTHRMHFDE
ncbi:hypothetical protein [Ornithinimicrobium cerasi]|uniref:hypothetical protein n=1 Tax=Ornithinimicrobium cerasi TaxID=2248773 RepID=UPI00137B59B5|nr:hypothetical protein [Ornithinimicrobium cerasi]